MWVLELLLRLFCFVCLFLAYLLVCLFETVCLFLFVYIFVFFFTIFVCLKLGATYRNAYQKTKVKTGGLWVLDLLLRLICLFVFACLRICLFLLYLFVCLQLGSTYRNTYQKIKVKKKTGGLWVLELLLRISWFVCLHICFCLL